MMVKMRTRSNKQALLREAIQWDQFENVVAARIINLSIYKAFKSINHNIEQVLVARWQEQQTNDTTIKHLVRSIFVVSKKFLKCYENQAIAQMFPHMDIFSSRNKKNWIAKISTTNRKHFTSEPFKFNIIRMNWKQVNITHDERSPLTTWKFIL